MMLRLTGRRVVTGNTEPMQPIIVASETIIAIPYQDGSLIYTASPSPALYVTATLEEIAEMIEFSEGVSGG